MQHGQIKLVTAQRDDPRAVLGCALCGLPISQSRAKLALRLCKECADDREGAIDVATAERIADRQRRYDKQFANYLVKSERRRRSKDRKALQSLYRTHGDTYRRDRESVAWANRIIERANTHAFFYGPYEPLPYRLGDWVTCSLSGRRQIKASGPHGWPMVIRGRHLSLLINSTMIRALRRETVISVANYWDVSTDTVIKWRRALHLSNGTRAGRTIKSAQMVLKRIAAPETFVDPGHLSVTDVPYWLYVERGRTSAGENAWSDNDIAMLRAEGPSEQLANRIGRSLYSVRSKAVRLGITQRVTTGTSHQCLRCGHKWFSLLQHPPVKCARCRNPNWQTPRKTNHLAPVSSGERRPAPSKQWPSGGRYAPERAQGSLMPTKPGHITSERARELAAMRKTKGGGGRIRVLRPCPKCGAIMGAREMRQHKCPMIARSS